MIKKILYGDDARLKLKAGVDKLCDAVKVTLGAGGRTVIITRSKGVQLHNPFATRDGITCCSHFELEDEMEDTGAMMATMASSKTAKDAGDGTTSTIILTQAMVAEGIKALRSGINPIELKRGMEKAVIAVVEQIKQMSIPVTPEYILQVATIAANNDAEIGKLIADAYEKVGKDGDIKIGDSTTSETTVSIDKGLKIDKGLTNLNFVNTPRLTCEFDNPYILIFENKIAKAEDFIFKDKIADLVRQAQRPLLIISDGLSDSMMNSLIQNHQKGIFHCCPIALPSTGDNRKEILKDIASATGATITGFQTGYKIGDLTLNHLGQADKVVVSRDGTLFYISEKEGIEKRVGELREQLEGELTETDKSFIQARIAKLTGGIATIHVGGNTEIEVKEKKDRVDDAIRAVQSAVQEGVVVGGGVALLNCWKECSLSSVGSDIVLTSLKSPVIQIASNCGKNGAYVAETVVNQQNEAGNSNIGYNALKDTYCDLLNDGIVDASKVVRCSVENASSVAIQILTSECLMCESRIAPTLN